MAREIGSGAGVKESVKLTMVFGLTLGYLVLEQLLCEWLLLRCRWWLWGGSGDAESGGAERFIAGPVVGLLFASGWLMRDGGFGWADVFCWWWFPSGAQWCWGCGWSMMFYCDLAVDGRRFGCWGAFRQQWGRLDRNFVLTWRWRRRLWLGMGEARLMMIG